MSSIDVLEGLALELQGCKSTKQQQTWSQKRSKSVSLIRSRFDSVSSLLLALLILSSLCAAALALLWWDKRSPRPNKSLPIALAEPGRDKNPEGTMTDFEPPGDQEVEELSKPTIQNMIIATADAISSVAAALDSNEFTATSSTNGKRAGDRRPPGPEQDAANTVPRFERWQLTFVAKNIDDYSKQLDHHRIELGAIGGGVQGVDYAASLSSDVRTRRGAGDAEQRLYFVWMTNSPLKRFDEQLLLRAGVTTRDRLLVKFIEPQLAAQLAAIELAYAQEHGHQQTSEIQKTVFESRETSSGYEFVVIDQRYRTVK